MPTDFDIALAHFQAGRMEEAESACDQLLRRDPNHPRGLHLAGLLAARAGRFERAIAMLQRAIARPHAPEVQLDLAAALVHAGKAADAWARIRILKLDLSADAWTFLIRALIQQGKLFDATAAAREAMMHAPHQATLHFLLGDALHRQNQWDAALASYREALRLDPDLHAAHDSLADALSRLGRFEEAIDAARHLLALRPESAQFWANFSSILNRAGRSSDAIDAAARAIELDPQHQWGRINHSIALLTAGRFEEGWRAYDWHTQRTARPDSGREPWDGSALNSETVVIRMDQGLGDAIQFVRYASLIRDQRSGRIVVECAPALKTLLSTHEAVESVRAWGEPVFPAKLEVSQVSLPFLLGTTAQTVPNRVPYLSVDPARVERLAPLVPRDRRLRVGLNWAGNPKHQGDHERSCPLALLRPLLDVPSVYYFNLQSGPDAKSHRPAADALGLIDLGKECGEMADLAAAMSLLDLVISVDTAPAHLAGALALPTWLMLPVVADFRWLREREDSPWYPTMRLFRQPAFGDWASVVRSVVAALIDRLNSKPR